MTHRLDEIARRLFTEALEADSAGEALEALLAHTEALEPEATPERYWGRPGDEDLAIDPNEILSLEEGQYSPGEEIIIEEWSVRPNTDHLPSPQGLLELIVERAAEEEVDETWADQAQALIDNEPVLELARALIEGMASSIPRHMANEVVGRHRLRLVEIVFPHGSDGAAVPVWTPAPSEGPD